MWNAAEGPRTLSPTGLRCEYLVNPLGIDVRRPRLSWAWESDQPGQTQTAYRIAAASSEECLAAGQPDLWDRSARRPSLGRPEGSESTPQPQGRSPSRRQPVGDHYPTTAGSSAIDR